MDMDIIQILGPTISAIATAVMLYLARRLRNWMDKKELEDKALREGLQSLLRDKILDKAEKGLQAGFATLKDKENLQRMYQSYHNLGGNDIVTSVYQQYLELPITH